MRAYDAEQRGREPARCADGAERRSHCRGMTAVPRGSKQCREGKSVQRHAVCGEHADDRQLGEHLGVVGDPAQHAAGIQNEQGRAARP